MGARLGGRLESPPTRREDRTAALSLFLRRSLRRFRNFRLFNGAGKRNEFLPVNRSLNIAEVANELSREPVDRLIPWRGTLAGYWLERPS